MIRTVCVSFAVSLVNSEHSADDSKKLIRFHSERIPWFSPLMSKFLYW